MAVSANYGTRARIGMILPSVNQAAEPQISRMLPDGVSLHTTRMRLRPDLEETVRDAEIGAEMLADAKVDLVVFHCTAASMSAPGFDDKVIARLEAVTGKPTTSTSKACLEAFGTLGARREMMIGFLAEDLYAAGFSSSTSHIDQGELIAALWRAWRAPNSRAVTRRSPLRWASMAA